MPASSRPAKNSLFHLFTVKHFKSSVTPRYARTAWPKQSVLVDTDNQQKAILLWRCVLQFMGDLPDARNGMRFTSHQPSFGSVMSRLYAQQGIETRTLDIALPQHNRKRTDAQTDDISNVSPSDTLTSRASIFRDLPFEDTLMGDLERVQYIVGSVIVQPELRDELFAILCKQLTGNSYRDSVSRGWTLFTLVCACVTPSKVANDAVLDFISSSSPIRAVPVRRVLLACQERGPRYQPPCSLELQHATSKTPIQLSITLMTGSSHNVDVDATCTAADVCQDVLVASGQKDSYGYALYIATYGKVASLGSGNHYVMDAISQCEQLHRDLYPSTDDSAPWRLYLRKELFAPWQRYDGTGEEDDDDDDDDDEDEGVLVYAQICRGVLLGEYVCEKDLDLALLAAQQCYVDYGDTVSEDQLRQLLLDYLPGQKLNDIDYWTNAIYAEYRQLLANGTASVKQMRSDVIRWARTNWPLSFSRYFDLSSSSDVTSAVRLAVNESGVHVLANGGHVLKQITYAEILRITGGESGRTDSLTFVLVNGGNLELQATEADDIRELVESLITGLRARSRHAIARDNSGLGELSYGRGDLLTLCEPISSASSTVLATHVSSREMGPVLSSGLFVLAIMDEPSSRIMSLFRDGDGDAGGEEEDERQSVLTDNNVVDSTNYIPDPRLRTTITESDLGSATDNYETL